MEFEIKQDPKNGRTYARSINNKETSPKDPNIEAFEEELDREKAIRILNRSREKEKNGISHSISSARDLSTESYKSEVYNRERNKNKRRIKGPKVFDKAKRFVVIGLGVLTLALGISGINELQDYKKEAYNDALNAVKVEIAEDLENVSPEDIKIYDKSSRIDESTYKEEYVVKIGEEEFIDRTISGKGNTVTEFNQIGDHKITNAIKVVANAENGSWFDAKKARELVEEIESGKLELNMATTLKLRQMSKEDKTH